MGFDIAAVLQSEEAMAALTSRSDMAGEYGQVTAEYAIDTASRYGPEAAATAADAASYDDTGLVMAGLAAAAIVGSRIPAMME